MVGRSSTIVVCCFFALNIFVLKYYAVVAENDELNHKEHYYKDEQSVNKEECSAKDQEGDLNGCDSVLWPPRLTRLDGIEVGHVQEVELTPGQTHFLHTVNMKPLIMEIPNFFTGAECEHIIDLAKREGLEASATHQISIDNTLRLLDTNGDQRLSLQEMKRTIEDGYDIYLNDDDIRELYQQLNLDTNHDDYMTKSEGKNLNVRALAAYINELVTNDPTKKSRYSEQAWIYPDRTDDELVEEFQRRIQVLTRLPHPLIHKFSFFQVVRYGPHGHYNAHLDSAGETNGLPCCHLVKGQRCRICRYMTIMVYLNDVTEGGETAFVVANNETFSDGQLRDSGNINLNNYCAHSKLHVKPERGKAVIWYNHFVDEETGWFGDVDNFTWHGGCPVTQGEKWIMNRWISVSNDREVDLAL